MATVTIVVQRDLHATPAAFIVARARDLAASVYVERAGQRFPASSINGLIALELLAGTEVTVTAEGEGAEAAVAEIAGMIERGPE